MGFFFTHFLREFLLKAAHSSRPTEDPAFLPWLQSSAPVGHSAKSLGQILDLVEQATLNREYRYLPFLAWKPCGYETYIET